MKRIGLIFLLTFITMNLHCQVDWIKHSNNPVMVTGTSWQWDLDLMYIPVENHTKIQLKTIPLIDAYLPSFFTNGRRIKDDKNEYETEDYSSPLPGWLFRA